MQKNHVFPLLPLLFNIVLKNMFGAIRKEKEIKGTKTAGINKFGNIVGQKINIQNLIVFLHNRNKYLKMRLRIPLTLVLRKINYLGNKLNEVEDID